MERKERNSLMMKETIEESPKRSSKNWKSLAGRVKSVEKLAKKGGQEREKKLS